MHNRTFVYLCVFLFCKPRQMHWFMQGIICRPAYIGHFCQLYILLKPCAQFRSTIPCRSVPFDCLLLNPCNTARLSCRCNKQCTPYCSIIFLGEQFSSQALYARPGHKHCSYSAVYLSLCIPLFFTCYTKKMSARCAPPLPSACLDQLIHDSKMSKICTLCSAHSSSSQVHRLPK